MASGRASAFLLACSFVACGRLNRFFGYGAVISQSSTLVESSYI